MVKTVTSLETYVARSISSVQGFVLSLDADIIHSLLSYQAEADIRGNLCEIGVHHGQLFLMLALARRAGERALAIDLFEDDEINSTGRHAGRDRALLENARRLGIALTDEETFKTSSLNIQPGDILARTHGPLRFISVDGGHLYHHVENDLLLAEKTLSEDGIIVVDDFFNPGWVDVTFATHDFLRNRSQIVPFALTSKKLYLASANCVDRYARVLRERIRDTAISSAKILGRDILLLQHSRLKRGYEVLRDAISPMRR